MTAIPVRTWIGGGQLNNSQQAPIVVRSTKWHEHFSIGRTQGHNLSQLPGFPKKIVLGRQARGYLLSELETFFRERAEREPR